MKDKITTGEKYGPAMEIQTQDEAVKALSKMVFADASDTTLTAKDRFRIAEKSVRRLVKILLSNDEEGIVYSCPSCSLKERLNKAHEVPMHRHGAALYILRKTTKEDA